MRRPRTIVLSRRTVALLAKPIRGQGGFQTLLRRLQRQCARGALTVSAVDVERLTRYARRYGGGGFQRRTTAVGADLP